MARIVVIGGSGHVGTFLVPRLVMAGHDVVNISRGVRTSYLPHATWESVETVTLDRAVAEREGAFGAAVAELEPDVVVDMICFTEPSARELVEALRGRVQHLLHCGTIWVYGHNAAVPATEDQPLNPFGSYGVQKAAIETYLLGEARRNGFPATVFRPGHITGPGWVPINPAGNLDPEVYTRIAHGETLLLPNLGAETVHHVHADDVAQLIQRAIDRWGASVGEAFNAVSPQALTLRGYAEHLYRWFGQQPSLEFVPFDRWRATQDPANAEVTAEHIRRSPSHSIEKARRLLGYAPRFTSFAAVEDALTALLADGRVSCS